MNNQTIELCLSKSHLVESFSLQPQETRFKTQHQRNN